MPKPVDPSSWAMTAFGRRITSSEEFIETTCRYIFYSILSAVASANVAILLGVPPLGLWALAFQLPPLLLMCYYSYNRKQENASASLFWLLVFAGTVGMTLGPILALIATTVPNGMTIIFSSLALTALELDFEQSAPPV